MKAFILALLLAVTTTVPSNAGDVFYSMKPVEQGTFTNVKEIPVVNNNPRTPKLKPNVLTLCLQWIVMGIDKGAESIGCDIPEGRIQFTRKEQ